MRSFESCRATCGLVSLALLTIPLGPTDAVAAPDDPIESGYVLTHEHPTGGMAFGGNYAFAGAEGNYVNGVMEKGYTAHCGGCKPGLPCDHGEIKGNFIGTRVLTGKALGRDIGDHRSHMGPLHNSNSHLRYSTEWIKEAHRPSEVEFQDTSAKIMVAFAVENEAMCEQLYYANKGKGGAGGDGYPCSHGDSWASMKRQLDALKRWVRANSDWMEIAYSAKDTRRIVNAGKLAVILGVEAEYAFGAEDRTFDPVQRLDRYYDEGVRTFYLTHKINSRLAGADIYRPKTSDDGKALRFAQAVAGCFYYDDAVGDFPLKGALGKKLCDNGNACGDGAMSTQNPRRPCAYKYSDLQEVGTGLRVKNRGSKGFNGFDLYPLPPSFKDGAVTFSEKNRGGSRMSGDIEINNLGLSHDGERVVRAAMRKGMIVNIDHVSSRARRHMRSIAREFKDYPLNALHNKPNSQLSHKKGFERHEYDFTNEELEFVRETGGFFGLRMGPTDTVKEPKGVDSGIPDRWNCPATSIETARMLAFLLHKGLDVGYSLDFATMTEGVHSRTFTGCGLQLGDDKLHMYGRHVTEGLSHAGMMKKWHRELETIGLEREYLDRLRHSGAEAFVKMWENSERKSKYGKQIERKTFAMKTVKTGCKEDSNCADGQYCARMGLDPRKNKCKAKKKQGKGCSDRRQCVTGRCSFGKCAKAHQCSKNADCESDEYCSLSGQHTCEPLKAHGKGCSDKEQCKSGRCSWGFCADADECRADNDCDGGEYCGDPVSGKRTCKALKAHGKGCTKKAQCKSGRCSWGFCADADECRSNRDCNDNQFCGDPIAGKRKCKKLLGKGKACTKKMQCASGKCSFLRCK